VQVTSRGPVPVKGLTAPIEIWEPAGASPLRSQPHAAASRGLTRFVGRDAEIELLRGALGQFVARLPCAECRNHLQTSPATADGGMHKQSRNRHDSDEKSSKFLADAGPLAAIGLSAFKFGHHRTLSLTALRPTAIENHLNVRVSREPLHQMIVQGRMPQRHDENVAGQACSHSSTDEAAGVVLSVVLDV
jgi:hypothetical protein